MANNSSLTATSGSGSQTTTQSPQSVGDAATTTRSTSLQPGTASNLLTSQNGVALQPTPLSTVSLNPATQTATTQNAATAQPTAHHSNPVLLVLCVLFLAAAVVMFWITSRSAKNTTEY